MIHVWNKSHLCTADTLLCFFPGRHVCPSVQLQHPGEGEHVRGSLRLHPLHLGPPHTALHPQQQRSAASFSHKLPFKLVLENCFVELPQILSVGRYLHSLHCVTIGLDFSKIRLSIWFIADRRRSFFFFIRLRIYWNFYFCPIDFLLFNNLKMV